MTEPARNSMGARVAALDCGTNTTRLLVAGEDRRPIERLMTLTRLGQGVDATGRLAPEAIERTLAALAHYRVVMDRLGVSRARLAATSAARDAVNAHEFFEAARTVSGVEPELLEGHEEGTLSFLGATTELGSESRPCLVVDIGGGSTEFASGLPGAEPVFVMSVDMGCVRVTERFLRSDPPTPSEVGAARKEIRRLLGEVAVAATSARGGDPASPFAGHVLIGLAGTVTMLSSMSLGMDFYNREAIHHSVLERDEVSRLTRELCAESVRQRLERRCLEPGRADVIAGGATILSTVMEEFDFEECLVSEADILDGLVASQIR